MNFVKFVVPKTIASVALPTSRIHTMTKGKATAVVSGRTIAETNEYETVEGNIYVRYKNIHKPTAKFLIVHSSHHRMLTSKIKYGPD